MGQTDRSVKNVLARSMPDSRERTVAVAHHPMEIQPWPQMLYPGGSRSLSQDHRYHLEAKEASPSSVIDVANAMAVRVRREPAQHGAGSVAFAMERITTGQSVRRPPQCRREVEPNPSRSRGKANLANQLENQRPNMLTPWCLRRSLQQRG